MRYPLLFGAALTAVALAACGGSSSETPPPLQPDPAGFRYAPASALLVDDQPDAGEAPRTSPGAPVSDPNARVPGRTPSGPAPAAH
ncbi:MAG TPA: hypothetical protein VER12_03885 [Polyangiaceae bacterium]|nr:hypothetical protein [Polyangiaceae bacterium]